MGESFGKTGVGQIMPQARVGLVAVGGGPGGNFLRDVFQRIEMPGGVAVAPGVIGDDGLAAAEKLDQVGMHGAAGMKHQDSEHASLFEGQTHPCRTGTIC